MSLIGQMNKMKIQKREMRDDTNLRWTLDIQYINWPRIKTESEQTNYVKHKKQEIMASEGNQMAKRNWKLKAQRNCQ